MTLCPNGPAHVVVPVEPADDDESLSGQNDGSGPGGHAPDVEVTPIRHFDGSGRITPISRANRYIQIGVQGVRCDGCGHRASVTDLFGATWCNTCAPPLHELDLAEAVAD
jgi:hypothetical protein